MVRVGIVGIGYWGAKVYQEYAALREKGRVSGVVACDIEESNLRGVRQPDQSTGSLDETLEKTDVLHVCTGNASHFDIASRALEAGNHVLVEKPLTTDPRTAFDLVELASERGLILQTGHIFRFADVVRHIRELYQDGFFGDVYGMDLRWTHRIAPRSDTNVLWDLLPHPVDIINFVTGEWPTEAAGYAKSFREPTPEMAKISMKVDGLLASASVSWLNQDKQRTLEIAGSERSIRADCVNQQLRIHSEDELEQTKEFENNTIRDEVLNFINAAETGENTFNSAIVGARAVDTIAMISETITHE